MRLLHDLHPDDAVGAVAFGFGLQTAAGLWMLTFDLNVTMEILVLNSAVQGFAVGTVWVPMTMVAFDTLAPKDRAEASSKARSTPLPRPSRATQTTRPSPKGARAICAAARAR